MTSISAGHIILTPTQPESESEKRDKERTKKEKKQENEETKSKKLSPNGHFFPAVGVCEM